MNISIIFTDEDVLSLANDLGVNGTVALERATEWESTLTDAAVQHINEQLASVVKLGQP